MTLAVLTGTIGAAVRDVRPPPHQGAGRRELFAAGLERTRLLESLGCD